LEETKELAVKYYNWKQEYDPEDYKQSWFEKLRYGEESPMTPKESFIYYNTPRVKSYEGSKKRVMQKYLLSSI